MAIKMGSSHGNSTMIIDIVAREGSNLEINMGDSYDFSKQQISIIESNSQELRIELARLMGLVSDAQGTPLGATLKKEVKEFVDTADKIVTERKWYSVSAKGLVEAAKAIGEAGVPILSSALKIIDLLKQAER